MIELILVVLLLQAPVDTGDSYMAQHMITRSGVPNKYDQYPFGTPCKVIHGEKFDLYIQFSHNEEAPDWQLMGSYDSDDFDEYTEDMFEQYLNSDIEIK